MTIDDHTLWLMLKGKMKKSDKRKLVKRLGVLMAIVAGGAYFLPALTIVQIQTAIATLIQLIENW